MQLKVEIRYIFFNNIYNRKKESEKRVERIKDKENERNGEISFLGIRIIGDGKPFYRLSKWLPLMNINGSHK